MNKQEANQVLNQVREGLLHPQSVIIKALTITGDIHAKCVNLESYSSTGIDDRDSPYMPAIYEVELDTIRGVKVEDVRRVLFYLKNG